MLTPSPTWRCPPQEDWFTDPDAVREKVGLLDEQPSTRRKEVGRQPGPAGQQTPGSALCSGGTARQAAGRPVLRPCRVPAAAAPSLPSFLVRFCEQCHAALHRLTPRPAGGVQDLLRELPRCGHGLGPMQALLLQGKGQAVDARPAGTAC